MSFYLFIAILCAKMSRVNKALAFKFSSVFISDDSTTTTTSSSKVILSFEEKLCSHFASYPEKHELRDWILVFL